MAYRVRLLHFGEGIIRHTGQNYEHYDCQGDDKHGLLLASIGFWRCRSHGHGRCGSGWCFARRFDGSGCLRFSCWFSRWSRLCCCRSGHFGLCWRLGHWRFGRCYWFGRSWIRVCWSCWCRCCLWVHMFLNCTSYREYVLSLQRTRPSPTRSSSTLSSRSSAMAACNSASV